MNADARPAAPSGPERIPTVIAGEYDDIARRIAARIAEIIRERHDAGQPAVLGLATGSTPIGIYRELIRFHREEGLDFSQVVTFNLDEYFPMTRDSLHGYHRFMWANFFEHVNVNPRNVYIPRGDLARHEVEAHCREYERAIAGPRHRPRSGHRPDGHIGFNEPARASARARGWSCSTPSRGLAAADFAGTENVPVEAITMGVAPS